MRTDLIIFETLKKENSSAENPRAHFGAARMPEKATAPKVPDMHARAVDDASLRLRELRREEWEDLGLAALAMALALAATEARPALALPLFLGGVGVGALGLRALWRRWDLLDRLTREPGAYTIPEVLACAAREATLERRHDFAELIRGELTQTRLGFGERVLLAADELEALASALEDDELALDPACAVACMRLVSDVAESPLLNPTRPQEELRSRVRQIHSGFEPSRAAKETRSRRKQHECKRQARPTQEVEAP
jgi:hypothetical protein